MENALLVGLSRQMALSHELDVVANNIANIDTTGFKADKAAFSEYLMPRAARPAIPRQRPARQLRAGPRHLDRFRPGRHRAHRQSAQRRASTARAIWWCRRRAASATPATARSRPTPPASSSPATAIRCSATAARSPSRPAITTSASARTASSPCARARAPRTRSAASCKSSASISRSACRRTAARPSWRRTASMPVRRRPTPASCKARLEKSNVNAVAEMARMIEITRSYTDIAAILQQQGDQRRNALQQLSQPPTS